MEQRDQNTAQDSAEHAHDIASGLQGAKYAAEGSHQHHAFTSESNHTGTHGKRGSHRSQNDRNGHAEGGGQRQLDEA